MTPAFGSQPSCWNVGPDECRLHLLRGGRQGAHLTQVAAAILVAALSNALAVGRLVVVGRVLAAHRYTRSRSWARACRAIPAVVVQAGL